MRAYFGRAVRDGADRDALVLHTADLGRPFPRHNPELLETLTPALAAALRELEQQSSIRDHVKTALKRRLASGRVRNQRRRQRGAGWRPG